MESRLFKDRRDAGRALAGLLEDYHGREDAVVLALPRGGVPVAYEVAEALELPLDVFLVRKLGVPGHEELAMGAMASGGIVELNDDVVRGLGVTPAQIEQVVDKEGRELQRRESAYRPDRPPLDVTAKTVLVVDDGLATGASMRAALTALREGNPARIVMAVPAAPESTCHELEAEVDEVVCATTPSPFYAVGAAYWDFAQVTDDEVRELMRAAATNPGLESGGDELAQAAMIRSERHGVDEIPDEATLFDIVGDSHFVLIGEASHGTHEFYEMRARMTQRLIEEKGFSAVVVEADWPDAYRVNRYVRGHGQDSTAEESLGEFRRFPTWMWRNAVVLDFVGWLRNHNEAVGDERGRIGFYGLDLYSLHRSAEEVIAYLEKVDPEAADRARQRYSCLDHSSRGDGQAYGHAAAFGAGEPCEREVVEQLVDLQRGALDYVRHDGLLAEDEAFYAQQNARTVKSAEEYYRTMFRGSASSWNLRDEHMADTLDALVAHLEARGGESPRVVVWAHNSHIGDARATEAAFRGELNLGQLVRQRHGDDAVLCGFTTHSGTVTAADNWGSPPTRKWVRPALPDSVEELFHEAGGGRFLIRTDGARSAEVLSAARLERAIGVVYRPETERQSHYFRARVAEQFDAVIHIDETRALEPLERTARWEEGEVPATYPHAV